MNASGQRVDDANDFLHASLTAGQLAPGLAPLRSYDVFDTVLTRLTGSPTSVFLLLGFELVRQGRWSGSADQFSAARVSAESRARLGAAGSEIGLEQIYRELAFAHGLTQKLADAISAAEILLEERLLRAVPVIRRRIEADRAAGFQIGFASDMYLPASVIGEWLSTAGVRLASDRLWVSSEYGFSKSDGRLFDQIAQEHPTRSGAWTHVGDNHLADVSMPASRGVASSHFLDCHLTESEALMERMSSATGGLSSLLAGASRWTRLSHSDGDESHRTMNDYAAQTAGPAVYAFVLWVLRSAQRGGIRKLWFMARDGQVMIPIAREIARRLAMDVEVGYLYGGRQVVKVAALTELDDAAVGWITGGAWFMTVGEMLLRVGVDANDVLPAIRECGLPEREPIGWERMPLLAPFLRHADVGPRILAAAAPRRADVLDYFRQCGVIGDERCCIIDIGWRGTVAKAIDELIGRREAGKHLYLYFGLYARPAACRGLDMRGYLFDADGETRLGTGLDIPNLTAAMEIFCQADHGSVLQLERTSTGFAPVCRQPDAVSTGAWDVPLFQRRLCFFAQSVALELCPDPDADLRGVVDHVLREALTAPTIEQARLMGSIPFIDDQAGSVAQPFAHAYGLGNLRAAFRQGNRPGYGMNWWTPGAWALTPPLMQFTLRVVARLGRLRRRRRL